ncbi:hypothetical protein SK3146_05060 [Paenibacillus konkukensis]|uniref:Uncharacterized protein n=1 Tax=Paenibacillus konkukensis TaxID=2020716 RepID=A0ABY4RT71_9BACL|nr:hypothetical protein SK3146_05060 [Paenibacillus konkukensis]
MVLCLLLPALFVSMVLVGFYCWGMRDEYNFTKWSSGKRKGA